MTLKEFREATKNMSEEAILIIDASEQTPWYVVEKPGSNDGELTICIVDKTGIDLGNEIDAAVKELGERGAIKYLFAHEVTLSDIYNYGSERLYILAKYMRMFEEEQES